jgi:hypothetical protein
MNLRTWVLPGVAAALVAAVLGIQLTHGGGDFTPLRAANPCLPRVVTSVATGIDGLGERLVLLGTDGAACRLGKSREALILELATPGSHPAAEITALRAGLLGAVDQMLADGSLPKAAALADEAVANADLPGLVKLLIRALPDSVINGALKTDDVLKRAINKLDLRTVLAHLDDPDQLTTQINAAVTQAVKDALLDRLRHLVK